MVDRRSRMERIRDALRPPRRLRLLRPGGFLIGGIFGLGLATLNTGNNLLYLLLGALLGFIALSGLLSEHVLRGVAVERRLPRAITAGEPAVVRYRFHNHKRLRPSYALTVRERTGEEAFVLHLPARATRDARATMTFARRGVYELPAPALSTTFPFGLFRKERQLHIEGAAVVRPPVTRPVRPLRPAGAEEARASVAAAAAAAAERGEFRALRSYRPGDDPRDMHWLSFARTGEPIVREYDRERGRTCVLWLDPTMAPGASAEAAIEIAAALAAEAVNRGDRFSLVAGTRRVSPGSGRAQLDRVLDALARVVLPEPVPLDAPPADCVWIGTTTPPAGCADAFVAGVDG